MARTKEQLRQKGICAAHQLNEGTQGWLGILAGATNDACKPNSSITAAAISYFALFSLFPIILLSISIASFNLDPLMDQHLVIQKLEFIAPALGKYFGPNIDEIIQAVGPVTSLALISLIWSASTIYLTLTQTLNQIWGNTRNRPGWKRRGVAIPFVLIIAGPVLYLASFTGSLVANLRTWLPDQIIPIGNGISCVVVILLDVAFFMVLYSMLPHGAATWREILAIAIGAGLLWELAKKAFLLFVASYISASNLVYGYVTAMIAFLAWAYLSSLILLFGAFLSVSDYRLRQPQPETVG